MSDTTVTCDKCGATVLVRDGQPVDHFWQHQPKWLNGEPVYCPQR